MCYIALDYILITGKNKNGCGYGWIKKSGPRRGDLFTQYFWQNQRLFCLF
jgi:hypothetical protein